MTAPDTDAGLVERLRELIGHYHRRDTVDALMTRAAARIASLSAEVERLTRERDEAISVFEKACDPSIKSMRLENGKLDMALGGIAAQNMALVMTEWFRESGAKNYVEMTLYAKTEPYESYQFFVQKQGDGARTPHQLRAEAEARAVAAEARLATIEAEVRADQRERDAKIADCFVATVINFDADSYEGGTIERVSNVIATAIRNQGDA